jgi:acyl-CoA dehydrogenase
MSIFSHRPVIFADETLTMFEDSVRRFFDEHAPEPAIRQWKEDGIISRDLWTRAAENGLLGLTIGEEYGGAAADFRFEAALIEEMFRRGLDAFGAPLHNAIVAPYIETFGTGEQRRAWLPKMVTGELIGAIAMTEPGTGSDLRGIRTTARREGDHYVVNGQKTYITNGQTANLIAVAAKTGEGASSAALSILVVETDGLEGFARGRNLDKVGLEAADTSELFFDNARVPVSALLGGIEGSGLHQLMDKLPQERLMIAIQGMAAIERALTLTIDFARQRQAFGKSILEFQNTQFKLAECKTEANIARVFVDHCIERHLRGELDAATASMAKYWVTDLQCKIIDECLQLHGGAGYMLEYPIGQMYRDARVQRIYGGTNEIMKMLIARTL